AICRIFGVSLNWLPSFARMFWASTPADLGLSDADHQQIKRLQVFGIQMEPAEVWQIARRFWGNNGNL
ncbi:MAG: hypothetical protein KDC44_16365, partial [Phaeodactylibacter sp.]|nr:hypothetical protein [Phaeodactylibacter sp.]